MQRRPPLTKPRQSPPCGLPGQTLEATASGHQGAEDETVRAHPGGRQGPASSSSPGQWATPAEQRWLGTGEDGDATGELRGSPESFRYRCPRALLGGHKGPSRGTSHATRRPAVFPPGLLPPYGAVGDNVRFSFFFFFWKEKAGRAWVWGRIPVRFCLAPAGGSVGLQSPNARAARGRERGQCWPPRPAARPAPRADRRARAGDGDRKAACREDGESLEPLPGLRPPAPGGLTLTVPCSALPAPSRAHA